jgi:hypothetical protein
MPAIYTYSGCMRVLGDKCLPRASARSAQSARSARSAQSARSERDSDKRVYDAQ